MGRFSEFEIHMYLQRVRREGSLYDELPRVQHILKEAEQFPLPNRQAHQENLARITQIFKVLLAEKARQEVVQEVRQDNTSNPEYGSTRPAHNPTRSVSVWNILKQQITRSG